MRSKFMRDTGVTHRWKDIPGQWYDLVEHGDEAARGGRFFKHVRQDVDEGNIGQTRKYHKEEKCGALFALT